MIKNKRILVTGAVGFIGTNLVDRYASENKVIGIDNMSRAGNMSNLIHLRRKHIFDFRKADITTFDFNELPDVDIIFHEAAQVGVGGSIADPVNDLNQNIFGTIKILEWARHMKKKPIVIFASTNKVYGELAVDEPVSETTPLDFHTPYGVSKGSADQYMLDYYRIYKVPTLVFRQSCIYGPRQLGKEEQGWVAWFLIADRTNQPITIFGDGNQVRDVLHVDDLMDAYEIAIKKKQWGEAFNTGGGPDNVLSLNELVKKADIQTSIYFDDWRPADQKYYVSDITKLKKLGWKPKIDVDKGIQLLKEDICQRYP